MSNEAIGPAPPPHRAKLEIVRVTWIEPKQFVCISPNPWAKFVHWIGGRSCECYKEHGECKRCLEGSESKWHAYIQVIGGENSRDQMFLEVTSACYHKMLMQLPKDKNWAGIIFRVGKTRGGPKGRYLVEVLERRVDPKTLPQSFDPIDILRFLWSVKKHSRNVA